jgi:hypothetical protein
VLIQLARAVNADTLEGVKNRTLNPELYVERNGLKLIPLRDGVPLIIDHDSSQRVGTVTGLSPFEDFDGPWVLAEATVTDPPGWLKRGTACSYGLIKVHQSSAGWVHAGLVKEVSLLSSAHEPREPRARVAVLERVADLPTKTTPVARRELTPARLATDTWEDDDRLFREWQQEAAKRGHIVRRGVGQVLGIR